MESRLVIIVGCQRSGTTLVGQILGAQPRAFVIDEEDGLYDWAFGFLGKPELVREPMAWQEVCLRARSKYAIPDERIAPDGSLRNTVDCAVLKAPNLTYSWAEIARRAPGSIIVYLFRDPRAIVASMLKLPVPFVKIQILFLEKHPEAMEVYGETVAGWQDEQVPMYLKMAELAAVKMSFAKRFEAAGLPVLRMRYKSLVRSPTDETHRLLVHTGVYVGLGPGGTDRSRSIDTQSLDVWRHDLPDNQQAEILERAHAVPDCPEWLATLDG